MVPWRSLVDAIDAATERELVEQTWQRATEDCAEGIKAMAERRLPQFKCMGRVPQC